MLGRGEVLVALRIPRPAPRTADAYLRLIPRTEMDIAVAGAGVSVTLDAAGVCTAARVAIAAVAPTPLLVADAAAGADRIARSTTTALARAAAAASAAARPIDDKRGTVDYRRTVAGVLTRRAAAIAARAQRAREDTDVAKIHVQTTINGEPAEFLCEPAETLLDRAARPASA